MSRQLDKQVNASLQTILDAANDLITEVGIPATAIDLIEGPRIVQIAFCECIRRAGEAVSRIDAWRPAGSMRPFPESHGETSRQRATWSPITTGALTTRSCTPLRPHTLSR